MKFRKINVHPLRGADPRLRAVAANFAFTHCTHAARREIEGAILEAYRMKTGNVAGFEQRSVQ